MTTPPQRQPAGVPTGGQFAPQAKSRSAVTLDALAPIEELTSRLRETWPQAATARFHELDDGYRLMEMYDADGDEIPGFDPYAINDTNAEIADLALAVDPSDITADTTGWTRTWDLDLTAAADHVAAQ